MDSWNYFRVNMIHTRALLYVLHKYFVKTVLRLII